jgi:PAS domain S-box-containing protein
MLQAVARVLVPRMADWCAVDLVETTGRIKRAVFVHRDGALQGAGIAAADLPRAQAPLTGTDAIRTARILTRLAGEPDADRAPDEQRALRELGATSWITLPIAGRVRVLGAISLGQAAPERAFTPSDVMWLRDLARRAALEVENARLHDMVARSRDTATRATSRAKLLQDVAASLSEALTPTGVTEVVVNKAREALRATGGALAVLTDDRTSFEIAGTVGAAEALYNASRRFPVHSRVPLADAGRSKEIVALDSIPAGVARYPHLASSPNDKLGALVAVPLVVDGQTVGAMGLVFDERRVFDHEDLAFLRTLARQCGDAVERTRLLGAERSARASADVEARRAAFLADASRILATSFDYQQTLASMARMLVPVYADWVQIHLAEPDGTITNAASIHADETKRPLVDEIRWLHRLDPNAEAGVAKVLRTGKPEIHFEVADILIDRVAGSPEHATLLRRVGMRSQMIIPLIARGRTLGAITFRQSGIRRFGLQDVPLAEELALRAALAVDNARLFHQAQEAFLRREESLALLGTLLSSAPIGIAFFDRDMTVARMNDALLAGHAGVAPIGARIEEALSFLPRATIESFRAVLTSGQPLVDIEVQEESVGAPPRHWLASCYPVQTHEGEVLGVGLVMTEITERKRAEQALRESEERARLLVEGVKDHALISLDPEGHISSWNAGAQRMHGYEGHEILGESFARFHLPEEDKGGTPEEELRIAREAGRCEIEGWRLRKDGTRFYANVLLAPLRDASGSLVGFSKLTRDLTDARRAREDLERARQQVARSEKLSTMGTLVSGVAHEIRTPLTAIANSVYMMKSRLDRAKSPEDIKLESFRGHMDVALDSVDRINRLVQDLRRFTKANVTTSRSKVGLQEVAQEALNLFRAAFRGRIEVISELGPTGLCEVDRAQVQQLVINLLQNASEAMPHGGSVRLVTESSPTSAIIRVIDTGVGMPPEVHRRMFEEFFTTKQEGTGLGLSIVRRIAETHGARIECDTALGKGTAFSVSFPLAGAGDVSPA